VLAPAITKEDELHWLALSLIPGLGTVKAGKLIERYHSPQAIFRASRSELESRGLAGSVAQTIASGCTFDDAVEQQQKMLEAGTVLVPISGAAYPERLREIFDPPIVLFARGRLELLKAILLGVVGTRRPTAYGTAAAERLAADLAQAGLAIVSGMARGIDTAPIARHSTWAATPSRYSAAAWILFIQPRTGSWRPKSPRKA
jgi:DNA processing protein